MNDRTIHLTLSDSRDGVPLHVSDEIKLPRIVSSALLGATVARMCALLEDSFRRGEHLKLAKADAERTAAEIQNLNPHGFESIEDALAHSSPQLAQAARLAGLDPENKEIASLVSFVFLMGARSAFSLATLAWNTSDNDLMQSLIAEQAEIDQRFRDAAREAGNDKNP